ncbi:MAG: HD-GYP domain-containing protein [Proteobacteria bacterium]|nr:HD-GYP domain-containing protein [Pseudomonadota bacterium]
MLKRIPLQDVRLGMYLHSLEGAWLNHPFWRTRFLIDDPEVLTKLHAANVEGVWIDVSKGKDVADPAGGLPKAAPPTVPAGPQAAPVQAPAAPADTCTLQDELARAKVLFEHSRGQMESMFNEARLGRVVSNEACQQLVGDITDSVFRQSQALLSLARIKTADDYTYMHSVAVCALMVALGRELGLDRADCEAAGNAGLFHDLGKAQMPLAVLNKPGKLTDAEFAIIKTHPQAGYDLMVQTEGAPPRTLDVVLHHHEKFDGSGYPHGLAGEAISPFARMGAICDVYDAITSNRCYKPGWDPAESIARMASWQGHFDPVIFKAFVKSLGIYPVGSLVRLRSGRLAVVAQVFPEALTKPLVKAFYSTSGNMPIAVREMDLRRSNDHIVGREQPEAWGFKNLDAIWQGTV